MSTAASGTVVSALVVGPVEGLEFLFPRGFSSLVDRAQSPAHALVNLALKRYDVILVDHTAEGEITEEQLAYLRALQALRPGSKTIVLAAHSTTRKVIEALRYGVFAYFSRPFDPSEVREAIAQALSMPNWTDGIELISAVPEYISLRLRCHTHTADRLALFMRELPCALTDEERSDLSIAFREMLLNAIEHGGKLNPDEWVTVSRVRTLRTVVYHIHDPGDGFSRDDLKHAAVGNPPEDPLAHVEIRMAENLRPGGFGMLITNCAVDEVIYSQKGNEVILIKHLD